MAMSKCPHCNTSRFEIAENSPASSQYKVFLVQCSGCGAPFGVMDYFNVGTLLKKQEKAVSEMDERLKRIEYNIAAIGQALNNR